MCKCNIHNSVVGKISFRDTESKDTKKPKNSVKLISLANVRSKLELKIK
jgi:hypothetical protein